MSLAHLAGSLRHRDFEHRLGQIHRDRRRIHRAPPSKGTLDARRLWHTMPFKSREESIPIAIDEGRIRSIDDVAAAYVPALAGTEYGRTPLRHLLQMASGVRFLERYTGQDDPARLLVDSIGQGGAGGVDTVKPFNQRVRSSGTMFSYASAQTQVLGLVLRGVVGRPVAAYLQEKIWEPIGAEADATWLVDRAGKKRPGAASTRCFVTMRGSAYSSRTPANGVAVRSSRRRGLPTPPGRYRPCPGRHRADQP
jgi:CubicO group peptidase (beta-lactamase class C family)